MSDTEKTKEQLIEELKALREQVGSGTDVADATGGTSASGVTRREVLAGWVAPVILTVPLVPRSGRVQAQENDPESDFVGFPTKLDLQVDDPEGSPTPTFGTTAFPTQSPTAFPTQSPTAFPTSTPTAIPTSAPTASPTFQPTAAPTVSIPVEVTEFDVNS